jgi:hypothetical protein
MGCDTQFDEPQRRLPVKDRWPRIETTVFPPEVLKPSCPTQGIPCNEDKPHAQEVPDYKDKPDTENQKAEDPDNEEGPPLTEFERGLKSLINKYCMENASATPDFILAEYMVAALNAFTRATRARERWYGRKVF